jgi:hypothetical protein
MITLYYFVIPVSSPPLTQLRRTALNRLDKSNIIHVRVYVRYQGADNDYYQCDKCTEKFIQAC